MYIQSPIISLYLQRKSSIGTAGYSITWTFNYEYMFQDSVSFHIWICTVMGRLQSLSYKTSRMPMTSIIYISALTISIGDIIKKSTSYNFTFHSSKENEVFILCILKSVGFIPSAIEKGQAQTPDVQLSWLQICVLTHQMLDANEFIWIHGANSMTFIYL